MTPGPSKLISAIDALSLSRCSIEAECLYFKLLLLTDGEGRFWGSPFRAAAVAFGHRMERREITREQVGIWIRELAAADAIRSCADRDGEQYILFLGPYRPIRNELRRSLGGPDAYQEPV